MLVYAIVLLTLACVLAAARVAHELGILRRYERDAWADDDSSPPHGAAPERDAAPPRARHVAAGSPLGSWLPPAERAPVPAPLASLDRAGGSSWLSSTATATSTSLRPVRRE